MTFAERAAAIFAAIEGKESTSAKAVSDAQAAQKAAEDAQAALVAEVGDPVALNTALDSLETLAGLTPQ